VRGLNEEDGLGDLLAGEEDLVFFPVCAALTVPVHWVRELVDRTTVICVYTLLCG